MDKFQVGKYVYFKGLEAESHYPIYTKPGVGQICKLEYHGLTLRTQYIQRVTPRWFTPSPDMPEWFDSGSEVGNRCITFDTESELAMYILAGQ